MSTVIDILRQAPDGLDFASIGKEYYPANRVTNERREPNATQLLVLDGVLKELIQQGMVRFNNTNNTYKCVETVLDDTSDTKAKVDEVIKYLQSLANISGQASILFKIVIEGEVETMRFNYSDLAYSFSYVRGHTDDEAIEKELGIPVSFEEFKERLYEWISIKDDIRGAIIEFLKNSKKFETIPKITEAIESNPKRVQEVLDTLVKEKILKKNVDGYQIYAFVDPRTQNKKKQEKPKKKTTSSGRRIVVKSDSDSESEEETKQELQIEKMMDEIFWYFKENSEEQLTLLEIQRKVLKIKGNDRQPLPRRVLKILVEQGDLDYIKNKYSLAEPKSRNPTSSKITKNWPKQVLKFLEKEEPASLGDILDYGVRSSDLALDRPTMRDILNKLIKNGKVVKTDGYYSLAEDEE